MAADSDSVVLDSEALDQLNTSEAKSLLDTVDSLKDLGIGDIVNLPQIIVVGDQSSGKSSVLEAISRLRFPVKGGLCTRFATELILRRNKQSKINVSIRFPRPSLLFATIGSTEDQGERCTFQRSGFDQDALPSIIEEAKEHMGIRDDGSTKGFSRDVLRIEIEGPDVYSLTLVDLPGLFHASTATQTAEDIATVQQLVHSYMKQENSIILAVISANQQHSTQVVLEDAMKQDPSRERTLGVITKPDLCKPNSSDESRALQLARNQEARHKLKLGWHVLRNRAEDEEALSPKARDDAEDEFFRSGTWSSTPKIDFGVESLRKKLSKVLLGHIKRNLPKVIEQIELVLRQKQADLECLGKPRSRIQDVRSYLLDISERFQRLSVDATHGRYGDKFFGSIHDDQVKLRALLRNLNRAFHVVLERKGATHRIQWADGSIAEDGSRSGSNSGNEQDVPYYLQRYVDLYQFPDSLPVGEEDLKARIEVLAALNQGCELPGSPTVDLVLQLFQAEALPWQAIAQCHLELAIKFAKVFVEQLLAHIIGRDDETRSSVLRGLVDPFFEEKTAVLGAKLTEILQPYTSGYGLPLEVEFRERLSKRTLRRLAGRVAGVLDGTKLTDEDQRGNHKINRKNVLRALMDEEDVGDQFGTEKVIDMMVIFYEVRSCIHVPPQLPHPERWKCKI
jgi:GTP-binding protein EngB required for normal cell division